MFRKNLSWTLVVLVIVASMLLSACGGTPTEQAGEALSVGIVLPTKDEPRWIQDETRFREALTKAGYNVEILFSQGSSAKEKEN
ncbi:MAG: sugar ABC transporter substrate-binding protein, partial [Chloroflexi bacterium]|nr:sugar ABC transporter substrate-binding protein [Chloroflexota bacterium]